jgi:hypothetical protein
MLAGIAKDILIRNNFLLSVVDPIPKQEDN